MSSLEVPVPRETGVGFNKTTTMIQLWGRKNAYNVQKILWILSELNINFIHKDVGSKEGDLEKQNFLKINPHSRIPVLVENNSSIWESNTIIRYLSASYSKEYLWPVNPMQRTYAERWMDWELATLQPDFIDLFWNYYRTPEKDRDANLVEYSKKRCIQHFSILNEHLKLNEYVAGKSFTMGDISCATCLYRYFEMGLNVEKPSNLMAWYNKLSSREAFKKNIMVSFDELKGRQNF